MADERSEGTTGQNVELVAATWVDSLVDAPSWVINKLAGSNVVPEPLHLGADVYANQTAGEWTDVTGRELTPDEVLAAAEAAEAAGGVIDAAKKTGGDIAKNPFAIIPPWAWVAAGLAAAAAAAFGVAYVVRAFK